MDPDASGTHTRCERSARLRSGVVENYGRFRLELRAYRVPFQRVGAFVPLFGGLRDNVAVPVERSERNERVECAKRHDQAKKAHLAAATRHDATALRWDGRGDAVRAELERRNARLERGIAELEGDRAQLYREPGS